MLIASKMAVFTAGFSSTSKSAAINPMIKNNKPFNFIQRGLLSSFIVLGLLVICAAGCASLSRKLGSQRVAAVIIKDSSPETIKASAKDVFESHGFDSAPEEDNELVFQKKASFGNAFLYSDWYSGTVWVRTRLYIEERKTGEILLDCDVFMVQDPEDPLFQRERKVRASKSEFQKLLAEVKRDAERK